MYTRVLTTMGILIVGMGGKSFEKLVNGLIGQGDFPDSRLARY